MCFSDTNLLRSDIIKTLSIARRDKKAFLNEQCKEIEENNRMGKTREISSRKMEVSKEHFMQGWAQ